MDTKALQEEFGRMDPAMKQAIFDSAKAEAQEKYDNEVKKGEFDQFLIASKERLDKHFDTIGYVCIIFDKINPENHFLSTISNVPFKGFMGKLMKYVAQYKRSLKTLGKLDLLKRQK